MGSGKLKARISELVRAAAKGEATILTDYGKPVAMVGPFDQAMVEETSSDAGEFREALLSLPYRLDVGLNSYQDGSHREECIEDLAQRHRAVCDPWASVVTKVGASILA